MIFLKVLAVVLGLAFLLFGYFIYFKKKYNLINGFEADFKAGRKKEEYAHYECAHFQDWSIAISNIQYGLFGRGNHWRALYGVYTRTETNIAQRLTCDKLPYSKRCEY